MRAALPLLLLAALTLLATTASAQDAVCPEVKPGVSIGPVKLGMTVAELQKLKLPVAKGHSDTHLTVGTFDVYLDQAGKVEAVGADSSTNSCVKLSPKDTVKLSDTHLASLAARFPKLCGPMQFNTGATVVDCTTGVSFFQHLGGKDVRVSAAPQPVEVTCDAWVAPESQDPMTMKATLTPGAHVCFQSRDFTADIVPDDVIKVGGKRHINTCERSTSRDGSSLTLSCHYDGIKLTFVNSDRRAQSIPKLSLLESIPVRK